MDYARSFRAFTAAVEADLNEWEDYEMATETLTLTDQAKASQATDKKDLTKDEKKVDKTEVGEAIDYGKQVEAQCEKMMQTIQKAHQSCLKFLNNTWESNEQWIAEYTEMSKQYKLLDEITLINWTYGHDAGQYLRGRVTKLRAVINTNIAYLTEAANAPENSLIVKSGRELDKEIVSEMGAPSNIDTLQEYLGHLRVQFRGRKAEKQYNGAMADKVAQNVRAFAKTKTTYIQDINAAERAVKSIEGQMKRMMSSTSIDDKTKRTLMRYMRSLFRMLTAYTHMIYFTYRMHTEHILNQRIIANRLFEK